MDRGETLITSCKGRRTGACALLGSWLLSAGNELGYFMGRLLGGYNEHRANEKYRPMWSNVHHAEYHVSQFNPSLTKLSEGVVPN